MFAAPESKKRYLGPILRGYTNAFIHPDGQCTLMFSSTAITTTLSCLSFLLVSMNLSWAGTSYILLQPSFHVERKLYSACTYYGLFIFVLEFGCCCRPRPTSWSQRHSRHIQSDHRRRRSSCPFSQLYFSWHSHRRLSRLVFTWLRSSVSLQHNHRSCDVAQRDDCSNPRRPSTHSYHRSLPCFIACTNLRFG